MNERLTKIKTDAKEFWTSRTKTQKGIMIGSVVGIILLAAVITFFATRTTYAPLYKDLSATEIGNIKAVLDGQGVPNEVEPGGTAISVPEDRVNDLLVQLAAEGYPESGEISYGFAGQSGFGMTDNEFNVMKLAATQTELANLIKRVNGVKDAKVMYAPPKEGLFLPDMQGEPTVAVILNTEPGAKIENEQVEVMYRLVEKSIPGLKQENISISDQYLNYFDITNPNTGGTDVLAQMEIKKSIERDLQNQVHRLLGTLMGPDKISVAISTDIDFKQEQREEHIVTPVDEENMAGIAISAKNIAENFEGTGAAAVGTPEAGQPTDNLTNYQDGRFGDGTYERTEDTVNYDVNRINKTINEAPFKVKDLGISVIIEPPVDENGEIQDLPDGLQDDVQRMLSTLVATTIKKGDAAEEFTEEELARKVAVSVQQMNGKDAMVLGSDSKIPWWIWVIGGILLVVIALLAFFIMRSRKQAQEEEEAMALEEQDDLIIDDINDEVETEATLRRKQLEKMAKDKPEDFAKLLSSWISEE